MKNKVIFFTGAGISKESGVPTFQEMDGIRQKLRRKYAILHPKVFRDLIRGFLKTKDNYEPNAAHIAIAQLGCPVITMNVDGLHQKAGSKEVLAIHGDIPTEEELNSFWYPFLPLGKPVLYGDMAPRYYKAFRMIRLLKEGDYLVIVGTSFYTNISRDIKKIAEKRGVTVITINENASEEVPKLCKKLNKVISGDWATLKDPREIEVEKIFERCGYQPIAIIGSHLPLDFMMFHSIIHLCGLYIYLSSHDICRTNKKSIDETAENLYDELHDLQYKFSDNKELASDTIETYKEKMVSSYKNVLHAELKHGLVRVMYDWKFYNENANVKSNYGDWDINYSPLILSVPEMEDENSSKYHASLFADAYVSSSDYGLLKVYFDREVKEEEVQIIYKMIAEVMDVINKYNIEEFNKKKNDSEYQHRDDWDPADF